MAYPYSYSPFGGYSPYQPMGAQNANIPAQQPAAAQTMPQMSTQSSYACRPVTSREEAIAVQADFFSLGTIMPDLAHGVIYLKRLNQQTGSSDFFEFVFQPPQEPKEEPKPDYVTREEFMEFVRKMTPKKKKVEVDDDDDE